MSDKTFSAFMNAYNARTRNRVDAGRMRPGQIAMNTLFYFDKEMYHSITGTSVDPFYDDTKMNAFMDFLAKKLH